MISSLDKLEKLLFERGILCFLPGSFIILNSHQSDDVELRVKLASGNLDLTEYHQILNILNKADIPRPVIIDIDRLNTLLALPGEASSERLRQYCLLSRIRFQGTDGIRGDFRDCGCTGLEAIEMFIRNRVVTAKLFALVSRALAVLALEHGITEISSPVLLAHDSRRGGEECLQGASTGFSETGLKVFSLGMFPTPGVPVLAAGVGSSLFGVVTASHNPASQNGLKLFCGTSKLSEEGPAGEFAVSALALQLALEESVGISDKSRDSVRPEPLVLFGDVKDPVEFFLNVMISALDEIGVPRNCYIVYDGANGAFSMMGPALIRQTGCNLHTVNCLPRGDNINRGGGVAELEGKEFISANDTGDVANLPVVREVFRIGREQEASTGIVSQAVYGLVNDGDGDRGYLLYYMKDTDQVHILNGDREAWWILQGLTGAGKRNPGEFFSHTIESDIMVSMAVEKDFLLKSCITSVGDRRLLSARRGMKPIIGWEESGHLLIHHRVYTPGGKEQAVYTGNGLLGALMALGAITNAKPDSRIIVNPYPRGISRSQYVYFVKKSLFFPGSVIWKEAERIIKKGLRAELLSFSDDSQVLCYRVQGDNSGGTGIIFVRNSGTENKSGIYIRCSKDLHSAMAAVSNTLFAFMMKNMKDADIPEAVWEGQLMDFLDKQESVSLDEFREKIDSDGLPIREDLYMAFLYGMRKQGLVRIEDNHIERYISEETNDWRN